MPNSTHPIFRAISLVTVAAMLGGCPAVEPIGPEPESPTPVSGVWGLQIADVTSSGSCGDIGSAAIGKVIRMDVDADASGELELSLFGFELFGGHADSQAWANAEFSGYWGWGYDAPVEVCEEDVEEDQTDESEEDEGGFGHSGEDRGEPEESGTSTSRCSEGPTGEGREPRSDSPGRPLEPGVYVDFDADILNARTMDGTLVLAVSDGDSECTFEADVNVAYLGEDVDLDLIGHPEDIVVRGSDTEAPVADDPEPME